MKFISELSLSNVISLLQKKEITHKQLIIDLVNKLDQWDTQIKAFLPEPNRKKRLLHDLEILLKKFPESKKRPILFGIPIGVKDIFHVDGFETKAGSNLPSNVLQGEEAQTVTKLKELGALILGKTVTTEFAYFHPGPTKNPHKLSHTPGGSSSGSAAAVAAGYCPLCLGTQTIGSISRPASFCGVIGFKPSFGRITSDGIIPFSKSSDHVGFFTQDLKGSKLIASILCDYWDDQIKTIDKPILGIPEGDYLKQSSPEILSRFYKSIDKLKRKDFVIKSVPAFQNIKNINTQHKLMNAAEFAEVHQSWSRKYQNLYHKTTLNQIQTGRDVSENELNKAKQGRLELREELENLQQIHSIDLWISPAATSTAPLGLKSTGNPAMNLPWTYSGLPTLTLPSGFSSGLPWGIQVSGQYNHDEHLYQYAKWFMKNEN